MSGINLRAVEHCRWDCVTLGEVMLRFDPGFERVRSTRSFDVSEGGGEYNVARALRRCFGLRTCVVTGNVDNELGRLLEELMLAGGVDTRHVRWFDFDGFGDGPRVGLNFTEKGFGIRPARSCYDRAGSATAHLRVGDIDWQTIFGDEGARWFHSGGIFAALSVDAPEVLLEAVRTAKDHGTVVSYDLNYRHSLWRAQGGRDRAIEVNRSIAPYVDVMIGNEEDFSAALGFELEHPDPDLAALDPSNFKRMIERVIAAFPATSMVATTLRRATTANRNDWGAIIYSDGAFHESQTREGLEIYDRVGGGDGFASGLIYATLAGMPPGDAVEYGAAHGALVMTTPGDTSKVSLDEVEAATRARTVRAVR